MQSRSSIILGISLIISMFLLGYVLGGSIVKFKSLERTVVVKGLAEKEVGADIALWPIQYLRADNDLGKLYADLEKDTEKIAGFLHENGFEKQEVTVSAPSVVDKLAQNYGNSERIKYRYSAVQTLTLYTKQIEKARQSMTAITALGKSGITFRNDSYDNRTEYIYTKLNAIKPLMIEEATRNARAAAEKFAEDSQSRLGKIKQARQGQFSIISRDKNTPHIKKVRIVSTIEYYLTD